MVTRLAALNKSLIGDIIKRDSKHHDQAVQQSGFIRRVPSTKRPFSDSQGAKKLFRIQAASNLEEETWLTKNESSIRIAPLVAGGLGIISVVLNRALSGSVGLDASSTGSRIDVVVIALSAVLLMTGLQWLALKPAVKDPVQLRGVEVEYHAEGLSEAALAELKWAWKSLQTSTRTKSFVVLYNDISLFYYGMANNQQDVRLARPGPICQRAIEQEKGNLLANLVLLPGRFEFLEYLPDNTQSVVIQPIGQEGVVVVGTNVQRGFSKLDQAWIAVIADKLSSTLDNRN